MLFGIIPSGEILICEASWGAIFQHEQLIDAVCSGNPPLIFDTAAKTQRL